ncbi:hypothetical protein HHI36_005532 [Cryptolaemus montrouzieri]|uniref:MADF domain-containing protein n=1 Tax=Cryptolaemus montrouzieri TaxID=559131 RepID=A0ABD2NUM9_9CUCU
MAELVSSLYNRMVTGKVSHPSNNKLNNTASEIRTLNRNAQESPFGNDCWKRKHNNKKHDLILAGKITGIASIALTNEDIKKRWRSLQDTFQTEFMKQMKIKLGSGGNGSLLSSWLFPQTQSSSKKWVVVFHSSNQRIIIDEGRENYDSEEIAYLDQADLSSTSRTSEIVDDQQEASTTSSPRNFL